MDKFFPLDEQIEMLASLVTGRVIAPHHAEYDRLRAVALANFDHRPAALVRPVDAADVRTAVNFARDAGLALAIRSGGHSTVGYGCAEGGLVIDLRDLNGIDLDVPGRTGWFGAGLTVGEVVAALEPHGLIIGFGDSATVGLGGITLGGGVGYLTRKFGLTMDSLLAAEIVLATGEIVVADADTHPDLFWALRGGGGNFGVVTRFRFRLNDLPAFTGGPLFLPATAEVVAGFAAAAAAAPDELSTIAIVMPAPPLPFLPAEWHGRMIFMGMMAYAGPVEDAAPVLAPFRALATPVADLVGPAPYASLFVPEGPEPAMLSMGSRFVDGLDLDGAREMLAALERCDAPMKMAQIRVLGGAAARVPADATAFAHRDAPMMIAFLAMYGGGPDVVARHDAWARAATATICGDSQRAYVNFLANEADEGIAAAYPAATLARLREVKASYDADNLFRLNQNIRPA